MKNVLSRGKALRGAGCWAGGWHLSLRVPLQELCLCLPTAGSQVPAGGHRGERPRLSFPLRLHLNNDGKATGLRGAGIMRRAEMSMCKGLIKTETEDTPTDANYLAWQGGKKKKKSNFPSGRFVTCLAEGAELRGEGWGSSSGAAAVGQPGVHTTAPTSSPAGFWLQHPC